jgi:hypothetical protein
VGDLLRVDQALYAEFGFARSLLAYELPDGRLKLLDVNDDEARALLLSIDPLAALAQTQEQLHDRLLELTPTSNADLQAAWEATVNLELAALTATPPPGVQDLPEQWLVLVTCRDEKQQAELLERFHREGLECKALLS